MTKISIRGARTHNLKNINLDLPRDSLIVITGLSGSGKSSLAFDTIYAEGQRRYVESLSSYARQFLSKIEKPDVDYIAGLSPAISIEQKSTSHNPRSTVGTITEIYDYLRLLYARAGTPYCPEHNLSLEAQTVSQMVDQVLAQIKGESWMLLAPIINNRKGEHSQIINSLRTQGFIRARIDGEIFDLDEPPVLALNKKHSIEVIVDRFKIRDDMRLRLTESFETALRMADGVVVVSSMDNTNEIIFSERYACPICDYSISELEPRIFSFNNPKGACPECDGLGVKQCFDSNLIVHDSNLSLADGAIRGWDKRNSYYHQIVCSLAKHYGFDTEIPFAQIPQNIQAIILYGSGNKKIKFQFISVTGAIQTKIHTFDGIIGNMEKSYMQTESKMVKNEMEKYLTQQTCESCNGSRLNTAARHVFVAEKALHKITCLPIKEALDFFNQLDITGYKGEIAEKINQEIKKRLEFLVNVGLGYLELDRSASTLSGGEAQRIRLASQIGAGLVGVMYILDEPSIGLHQRDNQRLLNSLFHLRDLGNTIIVVEHDEETILAAQHIVDIGPAAGVHGGQIVATGTIQEIKNNPKSLTGQYLSGQQQITIPKRVVAINQKKLISLCKAHGNNLKNINISFPIGLLTCVTGVSGSGKSTLVNDTLYRHVARIINKSNCVPAPCEAINGINFIDKVVNIDQSPIGRTQRSNPATYSEIFGYIRELFAATAEARSRGYTVSRFSFNVKGGRCEVCKGDGVIKVEMHFLPDIFVPCDACNSKRYNRETLEIRYKGKAINEILKMTISDAAKFFSSIPVLAKKLQTIINVGLSYITLGQNAVTLSGGEAQRMKLAKELSKRDTGKTLYILDEPTTGLHFHDIKQLLLVLHTLRDHGNTIVVIEHNLEVIKTADWIIDIGPEGGADGGTLVAKGTPKDLAKHKLSYTGHYLKRYF